jgi:type III restriction enzyme
MYQELADMACEKITAGITRKLIGEKPVKVMLDAYNPVGSSSHFKFTTSKEDRWQTAADRCHINWAIMDSDWESEFCRVVESHPQVLSYVKDHGLGFEVPYRLASEAKRYRPEFIVCVDDGHGPDDPLKLIIEIKGFRGEDAKVKKETMDVYWVLGVNNSGRFGRWAFAEFCDVFEMEEDFSRKVSEEFQTLMTRVIGRTS